MPLPLRTLGSTGCQVTALGLGGVCWNLVEEDDVAIGVVHRAIDLGITYLDTASGYKDSERKLGLALKDRDRDGLFVATKCIKRSGDDVKREIAQSFDDLGIETIDLIQLHAIDQDETLSEVLGSDGALRVIEEYQQAGKIRYVGLTGHTHPARFVQMIGEYDFDTVLNPMGAPNRVWNDFSSTTIPAARFKGMGIIGMKVMAYGQVPAEYRPQFLHYSMGLDIDVAIVGMDTIEQVEENVRIAEAFAPLNSAQESDLFDRAMEVASGDKKKLFWLPEAKMAS
ncbi:MAG: aldo/keto reductase [Candidatus Latescibacterota bacterium]|jgi:aryl-alcohol dehydrogenase-like predicted oxidoreductase|nr:aldo/keto reductase [Candidatus Latescibacterota bacterium]MEC9377618.1 aldo/keto reductase [Candidatus Latescibacterota bacterium]MEE3040314.1 aldo/keto reductase [Candidatus Latescibacterota bacterium]MEE3335115.1 aldo/keto reductase [Candidatus Latescibacterota bacterium]|tara:strand:- start:36 stop:884 length:849 start_codon:yes stop_codon:yes gene_type:complete